MNRRIYFDTIHNMRDLGGIGVHTLSDEKPNAMKTDQKTGKIGGKVIRKGMLSGQPFCSVHPKRISP